jgi:hypothetical protein
MLLDVTPTRRTRARLHALAVRVAAALAVVVLVVGVFSSGARFFFCPEMGVVLDAPCCDHRSHDADDADHGTVEAPDCCQAKRLAKLPATASAPSAYVFVAPACAAFAALLPVAEVPAQVLPRVDDQARARPPPLASERRAELMIFHI